MLVEGLDRAMEAQREGLARKAETLYRNSVGEI